MDKDQNSGVISPKKVRVLLSEWQRRGWLSAETASEIARHYPDSKLAQQKFPFLGSIILGGILLGLGIVFGVASGMFRIIPPLFWAVFQLAALALTLIIGFCVENRWLKLRTQLQILPPLLSFFLIGGLQVAFGRAYHLPSNTYQFLLTWLLAALPLAFLYRSLVLLFLLNILAIATIVSQYNGYPQYDGYHWIPLLYAFSSIVVHLFYFQLARHYKWPKSMFFAKLCLGALWLQFTLALSKITGTNGSELALLLANSMIFVSFSRFTKVFQFSFGLSWLTMLLLVNISSISGLWLELTYLLPQYIHIYIISFVLTVAGFTAGFDWILKVPPPSIRLKNIYAGTTVFIYNRVIGIWAVIITAFLVLQVKNWVFPAMVGFATVIALNYISYKNNDKMKAFFQLLLLLWLINFIWISVEDFVLKSIISLVFGTLFIFLSLYLNKKRPPSSKGAD